MKTSMIPGLNEDVPLIGWANYINGNTTPIAVPNSTETKLTLDTTAGEAIEDYLPTGITSIWNTTNNQIDLSELSVGDMISIRLDAVIETGGNNVDYEFYIKFGIGTASEFSLDMVSSSKAKAGTVKISRFNEVYIGSTDIRDNPAEIYVIIDGTASTAYTVDLYTKITKRT